MSVSDFNKVDMMGRTENGKCLQMVISDHLDWEDEEIHLLALQEKINAYLALLQDKKWVQENTKGVERINIVVFFLWDMTENCQKFLQAVQDQVGQYGVKITATIADDDFRKKVESDDEDWEEPTQEKPPKKPGFRFPFFGKK